MKSITIIGNLAADAMVKKSNSGTEYMTCRVGVNVDGEESAMWFSVRCFDAFTIKHMSQYLTKGKPVIVIGDYSDRLYLDKNNVQQISREINAFRIGFVNTGRGTGSGEEKQSVSAPQQTQQEQQQPKQKEQQPAAKPQPAIQQSASFDENDDLPF